MVILLEKRKSSKRKPLTQNLMIYVAPVVKKDHWSPTCPQKGKKGGSSGGSGGGSANLAIELS